MIESTEDLFADTAGQSAVVITTNGTLKQKQTRVGFSAAPRGVMGRGCAAQAKQRWPWLERRLGELLQANGNHVHILCHEPTLVLVSFPVKHEWHEKADLDLIAQSARELAVLTSMMNWTRVLLPRPGCGNGSRTWDEVKPVIEGVFDDRFVVTHQPTPREVRAR